MTDPSEVTTSFCLCIDITDEGEVTRVTPQGEISLSNADMLRHALLQRQSPLKAAVLDLSGVTFIDSSGLRVLLDAHARARTGGGSLVISGPTRNVERLLRIAGLWDRLPIVSAGQANAALTEARRKQLGRPQRRPAGKAVREWAPQNSFAQPDPSQ